MRIVKRYIFHVIAKCEHTQTNERTDAVLTLYLSGWFRLWPLEMCSIEGASLQQEFAHNSKQ